jgi:subtilase family serine protease
MARWLLFCASIISIMGQLTSAVSADGVSQKVCSTVGVRSGFARCHAVLLTDASGVSPLNNSTPHGYGPADFRAAYGIGRGSTAHVGIVVAYDDPNILADVNAYSKSFGLPGITTCSTLSQTGCLAKYSQNGDTAYPLRNSSWALETSMDVETVHGLCPSCRISLLEATTASIANLAAAADQAVILGATVISNSYGGAEYPAETAYDHIYNRPGVAMIVSSGDNGYGTNYPAASTGVVAVGGTSLTIKDRHVTSESAWNGSGSGCSRYELKPSWQIDKHCRHRSIADISADADPATGAAIYDSFPNNGQSGWFTAGGTSLAAPIIAGAMANGGTHQALPADLYNGTGIRDIIGGSNGTCRNYFCKAGTGYDGPTGLGVLGSF